MDLETVILSEVSQTEKEKYHMTSLICGILKEMIQMNLLTKQKKTDLENKPMVVEWGKDGGKGWLGSLDGHVHTVIFKMDNQEGPTV